MLILKMIRANGDMRIVETINVEIKHRGSYCQEVHYTTSHDHEPWIALVEYSNDSEYGPVAYEMVIVESNGKTSEVIKAVRNTID